MKNKHCPNCNKLLPATKFYIAKESYDGLSSYCKKCAKQKYQTWAKEHPERVKVLNKFHRKKKPCFCMRCRTSVHFPAKLCDICRRLAKIEAGRKDKIRAKKNNPAKWRADHYASLQRRKARHQQFIDDFKLQHPCICGETDIAALDLHHFDPSVKNGRQRSLSHESMERIKREIAASIIICANCHRKGHAGRARPEHQAYFPKVTS